MFGAVPYYQHPQAVVDGAVVFGWICLLATAVGMVRVLWRWRTARRAEQVLVIAIVGNLAVYTLSALVLPNSPHDIIAVVPMGAVLAARALVPERLTSRVAVLAVCGLAAVAALVPMSLSAARPLTRPTSAAVLSTWLSAHGLYYGLGNYWNASGVTLQSGNQVQVRTIQTTGREMTTYALGVGLVLVRPRPALRELRHRQPERHSQSRGRPAGLRPAGQHLPGQRGQDPRLQEEPAPAGEGGQAAADGLSQTS